MYDQEKAAQATKEMQELVEELQKAKESHGSAMITESEASNRSTDALNRLNRAQKKMDAWITTQRDNAPLDSDWARDQRTVEGRQ